MRLAERIGPRKQQVAQIGEESDRHDDHARIGLAGQRTAVYRHRILGLRGASRAMRKPGRQLGGPPQALVPRILTDGLALGRPQRNFLPAEISIDHIDAGYGRLEPVRRNRSEDTRLARIGQRVQHGQRAYVVVIGSHVGIENQRNGRLLRSARRAGGGCHQHAKQFFHRVEFFGSHNTGQAHRRCSAAAQELRSPRTDDRDSGPCFPAEPDVPVQEKSPSPRRTGKILARYFG